MTRNSTKKRKQSDPVWRRMYVLSKIETAKAQLLDKALAMPPEKGQAEIDALIADAFALKKTKQKTKARKT